MHILCVILGLLFTNSHSLESNDSPFQLTNTGTDLCLVKTGSTCNDIRWTTGNRLLVPRVNKCLGVQEKIVGNQVSLYNCNETSELQKWECKNETVLALQGHELYMELRADNQAVLSKSAGPNSQLTISGTSSGACTRTYRVLYTLEGNAAGNPCMFPFMYKTQWYSSCTSADFENGRLWCSVETTFENQLWGYCPTSNKDNWIKHPINGAAYQLNTESALTWWQAETSCKQQNASLLSITEPHQQAYITALLEAGSNKQGYKLWTGLNSHIQFGSGYTQFGWKWSDGNPFRYMNWDSGHSFTGLGRECGLIDGAVRFLWQSSKCDKKLGYICYSKEVLASPTKGLDVGFCSAPWIPYNGHCFHIFRTRKTWSNAQLACRHEGGDLVSIRNVEDQSFVISQLGYELTDDLWIGLNDRQREGLFDWSDLTTVTFTNWESSPSAAKDRDDCVLIRGYGGYWIVTDCEEEYDFICMKRGTSEPPGDEVELNRGCKHGWKRHNSYCYFIGIASKTYDEAKDDCKRTSSYLADVSDRVDNAFLVSLVGLRPEKHFWLGLSNKKHRGIFEWTSMAPVRYTHWNSEMPGHNQGCVAMTTGTSAGVWDVLPCTNREKYICKYQCKYQAEGRALTPAPTTAPSERCPYEWTKVISKPICFQIFSSPSKKRTWFEARDYCTAIGGDLLSIHSAAELRLLRLSYTSIWIGLSAPDSSNGYIWSDGSPVNFQHWINGEPNNNNNVETCVEMYTNNWNKDGSWNDANCEKYNRWVCQIRTGFTPKPPPPDITPYYNFTSDGWLKWKGNQYYINNQITEMEDARQFCKDRHGDLVTFESQDENVFLWKHIYKEYANFWIGLTVDFDRSVQWIDGSPVLFQWWADHQPDFRNFDENCVAMTSHNGFWHDYNCGFAFKSICKRSGSPPANATVAPKVPPKGGCEDSWKMINFTCYKIINDQKLTWHGAREQCRNMSGNLAYVPSRQSQVFLVSQMSENPTSDLWIGIHNIYKTGFYWTDGRPKLYSNFNFQERSFSSFLYYDEDDYEEVLPMSYGKRFVNPFEGKCVVINTNLSLGIGKWIPKSCNETYGFICLKDVDPNISDSDESKASSYIKIANDSVKLIEQQMTWDAARKNCEADGANLVSIRTEWMQAYIELQARNLNRPLWIGLNKAKTNNYFKFIEGWDVKFTHWGNNEPLSRYGTCVYVDVDGTWKTGNCNKNISSICMKSTDTPPTADPIDFPRVCPLDPDPFYEWQSYSWIPFRRFCYLFISDMKEWAEAATSCVAHGGSLVSIGHPTEQEFIESNIRTFRDIYTSYWLGLFKTQREEWLWLDKTVMDYANWDFGEPSYETFGQIRASNGKWHTGSQRNKRPYICKTAQVLPSQTSPSPHVLLASQDRSRILLAVLLIAGAAVGAVIVFVLFKKSSHHLPITRRSSTFDNPLLSNNRLDLVDNRNLEENALRPVISL